MKFLFSLISLVIISSLAIANNITLAQAAGKTNLTAKGCEEKARSVFKELSYQNIDSAVSLADGKKPKTITKNSSRTVRANDEKRQYSIQCYLFQINIVNFTTAGEKSNDLQKIWNSFYNIK